MDDFASVDMTDSYISSFFCQLLEHPLVGRFRIIADSENIREVAFLAENEPVQQSPNALTIEASKQLHAYFDHQLKSFDLPLMPSGTEFQCRVWHELCTIPFGKTMSYLALSGKIGNDKAIRAVGRANGQNPIAIIIPCHRVIGSDGSLTGYSGGLWRKRNLLRHEGVTVQQELFAD